MKSIITFILLLATTELIAQSNLIPGKNSFESKWIKSHNYHLAWYALRDSVKIKIADVFTKVIKDKKQLFIITEVKMSNSNQQWIDTTEADIATLSPIRHSSYNHQRDMVLSFGKITTGFYTDKLKGKTFILSDTTTAPFFDSNLYPSLLQWLPLTEGYTQNISIYDYNPYGEQGIMSASINQVKSGEYESEMYGVEQVWIITVTDEIGNTGNNSMVFYIDKQEWRLLKQEIYAGEKKMMMLINERQ